MLELGTVLPREELFQQFLNYAAALGGKKEQIGVVPVGEEMALVSQAMMKSLTDQQMKGFAELQGHPDLATDADRKLFYKLTRPASSMRELKSWEETALK